jgi:hypothetical protein
MWVGSYDTLTVGRNTVNIMDCLTVPVMFQGLSTSLL